MAINGEADNGRLIASVNGVVYPLSNEECVFRARDTGEKHVMTMQVLRALDLCSYFRPLDEHVQVVMNGIAELKGRDQDVRRVLEALISRGLMVTAADALEAMPDDGGTPASAAGVMVRSSGRPRELDRLLSSLSGIHATFGVEYPCYVFDDSGSAEAGAECEALCARWRDGGLPVHWLGEEWQRRFADDLVSRSGQRAGLADWLLMPRDGAGFTGGRALNLILLAAAGRRFVLVDEDLVLEPRMVGDPVGMSLAAEGWEVWFHGNADEAAGSGRALDSDPIADLLAPLGRPLPWVVKHLAARPDELKGVDQRTLQSLGSDAPLIGTTSGIYGDAATGASNGWCYTLSGPSRDRFRASREDYDRNRRTRWVTRARPRASLLKHTSFTRNGMDGSRMLPPTLPFGRSEDRFQNSLTTYMYPGSRVLDFPWALGHFPLDKRKWSADALKDASRVGLADFLSDTMLQVGEHMPGQEPGTRLRLAAEMLGNVADMTDAELSARLDEYLVFIRSDLVAQLQRQLAAEPNAPVYWAADVRAIIETNSKALMSQVFPRLVEMPTEAGDGDALAWLRREIGALSESLRAWPELWNAARETEHLPG